MHPRNSGAGKEPSVRYLQPSEGATVTGLFAQATPYDRVSRNVANALQVGQGTQVEARFTEGVL